MEHCESADKDFKKALRELNEQTPVLGLVLRAIIAPIGAALYVSACVLQAFKRN